MMKKLVLLPFLVCLLACTPLEQQARNTAAALQGAIVAAQNQYGATCKVSPTLGACVDINKAVLGQNALVTAVEAYCGWSTTNPPATSAVCVPVKTAQAALQTAIANSNAFIVDLKGILK